MEGTRDECEPQTQTIGQIYGKNHLLLKHTTAGEKMITRTGVTHWYIKSGDKAIHSKSTGKMWTERNIGQNQMHSCGKPKTANLRQVSI